MGIKARRIPSTFAATAVATVLLVAACSSAPADTAATTHVESSSPPSVSSKAPSVPASSTLPVSTPPTAAPPVTPTVTSEVVTEPAVSTELLPSGTVESTSDEVRTTETAGTEIVHVKPTDDGGNVLDQYSLGTPVEEAGPSTLSNVTPSQFGGSAYAISASVTGGSMNSCWPTAQPNQAVCLWGPDDTSVIPMNIAEDLPIIDPVSDFSPDVRPWQIQLDDGLVCYARTHGATSLRDTYLCIDPTTGVEDETRSTVSGVDTSGGTWTIQQVDAPSMDAIPDRLNPPTRTAEIVKAWFNG
jgi:hypothetical protein